MKEQDINYDANDRKYCYRENPGVLKNKLHIRNLDELHQAEREVTSINLTTFILNPVSGNFDFRHLKKIHYAIFSEIYDFAGEVRELDISKNTTSFCGYRYIEDQASLIFRKLNNEKFEKMYEEEFFSKIAEYMGELNALHPFREGNGRAMREFFRLFCLNHDYELNYSNFYKEDVLSADISAFNCRYTPLIMLFKKGVLRKLHINSRFN